MVVALSWYGLKIVSEGSRLSRRLKAGKIFFLETFHLSSEQLHQRTEEEEKDIWIFADDEVLSVADSEAGTVNMFHYNLCLQRKVWALLTEKVEECCHLPIFY